jgi:hypothetical protein
MSSGAHASGWRSIKKVSGGMSLPHHSDGNLSHRASIIVMDSIDSEQPALLKAITYFCNREAKALKKMELASTPTPYYAKACWTFCFDEA